MLELPKKSKECIPVEQFGCDIDCVWYVKINREYPKNNSYNMPAVLIVCTANVCRSPMAEAILKKLISTRPDAEQWHIESAGTWADNGREPAFLSKYVMEQMGMDISNHLSKPVSLTLIADFDLILTMEIEHKDWLSSQYEDFSDRIYLLSEMVGDVSDIPDPIGGELYEYQATALLLTRILTDGLDRICEIACS